MPTNLGHEAISGIKVGHVDATAAYLGHEQVFPNSATIQTFVFTDTSNLAYDAGSTRIARVTGEIGSTYSLAGTNGVNTSINGNYTLSTSPTDHNAVIAAQSNCAAAQRTPTVTLTPLGSTVLQGGGSTFTVSITQTAGPGVTNNTSGTLSISCSTGTAVTNTIGGTLYFVNGSTFNVSYSWSGFTSPGIVGGIRVAPALGTGSFTSSSSTYVYNTAASGSGTDTFTLTNNQPYMQFVIQLMNQTNGCVNFTNNSTTSNSVTP